MEISLALKLLLSLVLGGLIGLERESGTNNEDYLGSMGGIRTFALLSLFGGISGIFYNEGVNSLFLILTISVFVFVFGYYIIGTAITKLTGMTTELSALYTFVIGFLITTNIVPIQLTMAILVVLVLVLSMKSRTKKFAIGMERSELESFITYAIIALVILPFLPNKAFYLQDIPGAKMLFDSFNIHLGNFSGLEILNPYRLWLIVALITGIDLFGYILGRLLGRKNGIILTSAVGGFISSTSTTISLAQKSNKFKLIDQLVGAAVIANLTSFIEILILITPLNPKWAVFIIPTVFLIIVAATMLSFYYLTRKNRTKKTEEWPEKREKSLFSLIPALKFAILLTAIKIVTKSALLIFGKGGFILSSMIASLAGIDAIMVNLADMAGKTISFKTALLAFVLVNATNLISKSVYSYTQGGREFARKILVAMIVMVLAGFIGYLIS